MPTPHTPNTVVVVPHAAASSRMSYLIPPHLAINIMLHRTLFMIAITILSVLSGTFMLAITNNHPSIHLSSNAYVQSTSIHQTTPWTLDKDLRVIIPPSMILIGSSLLWCPNAKAGTTAVYDMLWKNKIISYTDANRKNETTSKKRCSLSDHCPMLATTKLKSWSSSKPVSFVIVRNPYDRLRSAYVNKIQTGKIKVKDADNRPVTSSFYEFVVYVSKNPTKNVHWSPVSSRCLTGSSNSTEGVFKYDYILKLEEDDVPQKLEEIFQRAGIYLPLGIEREPVNQHTDHASSAIVDFYREAAAESEVAMEELIGLVGDIYRDDIEPFGYSFPKYQDN